MILVLLGLAGVVLIFDASMISFLASFSRPFHSFCLQQIPSAATSANWLSSVVCGGPSPLAAASFDLRTLGFFRLFILSGTQILILDQTLRWIVIKIFKREQLDSKLDLVSIAVVVTYAALAAFPAALVRVMFQFALKLLSRGSKLFWRPAQITLLAGLITLASAPELASSLSLQIGWLASLILSGTLRGPKQHLFAPTRSALLRQFILYIALFIPLLPLGVPHPLSILVSWLLTPFLMGILFPLSVATVCFHVLTPAADFAWSLVTDFAQTIGDLIAPIESRMQLPSFIGWVYLGCVQIFFLFRERVGE